MEKEPGDRTQNDSQPSAVVEQGEPPKAHDPSRVFQGAVKSFEEARGFGFILCNESRQVYGKDVFVLRSELHGAVVNVGDKVRFRVTMGSKGPQAADCVVLRGAEAERYVPY